jgi:hypothetical protein
LLEDGPTVTLGEEDLDLDEIVTGGPFWASSSLWLQPIIPDDLSKVAVVFDSYGAFKAFKFVLVTLGGIVSMYYFIRYMVSDNEMSGVLCVLLCLYCTPTPTDA